VNVPLGSIVYLANYMVRAKINAETTMPDTPNMYSADLDVINDHGGMDLTGLAGQQGRDGQIGFQLRQQRDEILRWQDLPVLTNTREDIGKYWVITTRDDEGTVIEQWAYIWFGTMPYHKVYMGAEGPPGRIPQVRPTVKLIDPKQKSFIDTTGGTVSPSWRFNIAAPTGKVGPVRNFDEFPDFDTSNFDSSAKDADQNVIMFTGEYDRLDRPIFAPMNIQGLNPVAYSIPEDRFGEYHSNRFVAQRVTVGKFSIPPQPFDWTPIVWGHITLNGTTLALYPVQIGCEVLLGNPKDGTRLARGFGSVQKILDLIGLLAGYRPGEVNIMPHYSTPDNPNRSISPTNRHAVIPAQHKDSPDTTFYVNLYNDGIAADYDFYPKNAQLLVMVVPVNAYETYIRRLARGTGQ